MARTDFFGLVASASARNSSQAAGVWNSLFQQILASERASERTNERASQGVWPRGGRGTHTHR